MKSPQNPLQTVVNDTPFWLSSVVAKRFGYTDVDSFRKKIVPETTKVLIDIGVPYYEHVLPVSNAETQTTDFLLSRFACWIASLHSDGNKKGTLEARNKLKSYFEQLGLNESDLFDIRRFPLRKELSKSIRRINSIAAQRGLRHFSAITESGYQGLYGMSSRDLEIKKGLNEKDNIYDYMDSAELSLNLLRINLGILALKRLKNVTDDSAARHLHKVGRSVRSSVYESTGSYPENWPLSKNLKEIRKTLKSIIKDLE